MAQVPFLSRLPFRDYVAIILSFAFLLFESLIRFLTLLLPIPVIGWFRRKTIQLWQTYKKPQPKTFTSVLQACTNFTDMCAAFGYEAEEHVLQTKDGYLLCLHRLCRKKGEPYSAVGSNLRSKVKQKPVVYLHHGLLMNSEVWVCQLDEKLSLPFRLVEEGYDVWFGNNRGNKYSKKSLNYTSSRTEFWNFSMDEFAFYDIPDSIDYILHTTRAKSLSYIGFSQGTAQAFAALSIHPQLNEKVNVFVALAPAISPKGLSNPIVDAFIKASPAVLFLLFGRKALLTSTIMWQSIICIPLYFLSNLDPPIFVRMIDISCSILFGWTAHNIPFQQKVVSYAHLYSYTSVKTLVHWFQIIRAQTFQMFDDEASGSIFGTASTFYKVASFPTKNIHSPIVLIYGGVDSLVDIDVMLAQLPPHTVAKKVENYEHLDILWGKDVDKVVFPYVLDYLKTYAEPMDGSKIVAAESKAKSNPPSYSKATSQGLRKRSGDSSLREQEVSYVSVASSDTGPADGEHSETVNKELGDDTPARASPELDGSDSDQTVGDDQDVPLKHDATIRPGVSFADIAMDGRASPKTILPDDQITREVFTDTANTIRKSGTWGVSYEEAAWAAILNDRDNNSPLVYTHK